jgi:hypothetical protein
MERSRSVWGEKVVRSPLGEGGGGMRTLHIGEPALFKPPALFREPFPTPAVFLAGTIDMGDSEDWQSRATELLMAHGLSVLNPRRDDWDSSWEQTIANEDFRRQVEWELTALNRAKAILMHIITDSKSPITLMELGFVGRSSRVVVSCEPGFYRRGNVEVFCNFNGITLYDNLGDAMMRVVDRYAPRASS